MESPASGRVLVVDDDEAGRASTCEVLRRAGFAITEAGSVEACLRAMESEVPDLLLLDEVLPDGSGLELCRRLREEPRTGGLPVVLVSGVRITPEDQRNGLERGADAYLVQPVEPGVLTATVRARLRRSKDEEAVRSAARRLRQAFSEAGGALWEWDPSTDETTLPEAFAAILGLPAESLPRDRASLLASLPAGSRRTLSSLLERARREPGGERETEIAVFAAPGLPRRVRVRARGAAGRLPGSVEVLGSCLDVTERRALEEKSRASRRLLQAVVDAGPSLVYATDPEGRFVLANAALESLLGVPKGTLVGRTRADVLPAGEAEAHRKNDLEALAAGRPVVFEETKSGPDGTRTFSSSKFALLDEAGRPFALCGISTDVTEQKAAEDQLRAFASELDERVRQRSAALESLNAELESFTRSVSHDLRAPLRAIDGYSAALAEDLGPRLGLQEREQLGKIRSGVARMSRLVDDLLRLSRASSAPLQRSRVDLGELSREVAARLLESAPERAVEFVIGRNLVADADEGLVRVLLENLLGNAWKFTATKPAARIEVASSPAQGEVVFRVSDDGVGFDPERADRLFGVFQRLHDERDFPGTGIGLATVRRIVSRHGGWIRGEGEAGRGATFRFTLGGGPAS